MRRHGVTSRSKPAASAGPIPDAYHAAQSGREKVEFIVRLAAELAHFNNNALGVAQANVSLVLQQQRGINDEGRAMLEDALLALDNMQSMSKQLEIFANTPEFREQTLDLGRLMQAHAAEFRAACGSRPMQFEIAQAPMPIRGDPRHLRAAIMALLPDDRPATNPAVLILRCIPRVPDPAVPGGEAGRVELSLVCADYCGGVGGGMGGGAGGGAGGGMDEFDTGERLLSRRSGYLELGLWFARQVALASGGRFFHALDDRGEPTRMLFTLPAARPPAAGN